MQQPRIEEKLSIRLVGMDERFIHCLSPEANNAEKIFGLWERFSPRLGEIKGRVPDILYGMCGSLGADECTHPDERHYAAGAVVPEEQPVPEGMQVFEIPGTTYAIFEHRGPIDRIADTVGMIYRDWLPAAEHVHSGLADVEQYDVRFQGCDEGSVMEYWIPVRPKEAAAPTE